MGQAEQKVRVWLIWLVAVLVTPDPFEMYPNGTEETSRTVSASTGVVVATEPSGELFPWLPNYRWRKLALNAYRRGRRLYRLHAPRALRRVADWLGQMVLVQVLGVDAAKFKKDRLARTLDAIAPHTQEIWQAVVSRAIKRYNIDLSVIYDDLTAFILHGEYQGSELVTYGFAHNTPSNKQKIKTGLNAGSLTKEKKIELACGPDDALS